MRFVKISDAQFHKTNLINSKIFNLKSNNEKEFYSTWKSDNYNTVYEIINPEQKSRPFTILLSEQQFNIFNSEKFYKNEENKANRNRDFRKKEEKLSNIQNLKSLISSKNNILKNDITVLFSIINNYTKNYINKEIAFYTKYFNNETPNIIDNLTAIRNQIPDDSSACVLRMSAGSGFHSVTGDWRFETHKVDRLYTEYYDKRKGELVQKSRGVVKVGDKFEDSAKSRKIAVSGDNYMPMGFIKLQILTEEEIAKNEKKEAERMQIELEKAEKQLIENKKAEKLRLENEKKYNSVISEADTLFKEQNFETAIEKYKQAQELKENNDYSESQITKAEQEIEKIKKTRKEDEERKLRKAEQKRKNDELKEKQEANKQQKEKENSKLLETGLILPDDLNNFNEGRKITEVFFKAKGQKYIESDNAEMLKTFVRRCFQKSNKRWKKKGKQDWKLVEKWVGKPTAQSWYDEIIKTN